MLRNPLHIYGADDANIPADLHFGKYLLQMCIKFGDNIALIDADTNQKMTYKEVAQLSVNIALSLKRLNVSVGDVVSICCEKRTEFMPTVVGILCTGATFSAADNGVIDEQILYRLSVTKPKVLFLSKDAYEKHQATLRSATYIKHIIVYTDEHIGPMSFKQFLTEHAPIENFEPTPVEGWKEIAIIQFSSGTSGMPKAAKYTHRSFLMTNRNVLYDPRDNEHYTVLSTREWYYSFGLYHTLASLSWGYTIVFTLKNDTKDYLEAIEKYKVDNIQIVPTTITDLIKYPELHKYDVSSLQVLFCTSIPISSELLASAKDKFKSLKKLTQIYGLTEVGCIVKEDGDTEKNKLGSVGVACAGTVFKVVDLETQQPVGPYKHGEIRFKSLSLMSGYIGDEERAYLDEEGFYKSGDVGYYDDDKHFYIVDRIKEMIKYKGCSLSPSEIENVLLKHPSIRDVGVTSLPFSEAPIAFIVRQTNCKINEKQVAEYLSSKMPSVTMSGGIRFVEKLPRGAGTKLDRKALRNMI